MRSPPFPRGCPGVEVEDIDAASARADADERAGIQCPEVAQNPGSVLASRKPCGVVGHFEAVTGKHKSPVAASSSATASVGILLSQLRRGRRRDLNADAPDAI